MSFNLDAFMAGGRDFARGYTFYATFSNTPSDIINNDNSKFLVRTASLPVGTITPIETSWQGNKYKLAGVQEFTDFNIGFNIDPTKENIRSEFVKWQHSIHEPEDNVHGNPSEYMAQIQLEHLDHRTEDVLTTYQLLGAWPTSVGEVSLDYASQETAQFEVTFTYQLHTIL